MIDMKRAPREKEGSTMLGAEPMESDAPEYPWDLRITLDSETLDKLGMTEMPGIDQEFKVTALCCVVSVSQHEGQGESKHRTVELQIEQMELAKASEESGEGKSPADRLYGS